MYLLQQRRDQINMLIIFQISFYLLCGILAYGILFAYQQVKYELKAKSYYDVDRWVSIMFGLLGPLGLLIVLFITGFAKYGVKFW